jgi:hypothetical protein
MTRKKYCWDPCRKIGMHVCMCIQIYIYIWSRDLQVLFCCFALLRFSVFWFN